jgi:RNA polymerase sigma factor (sigma-70 family)
MQQQTRSQDDAELVRQTLAGRREAFGLLYDRYAAVVRALAWDATRHTSTMHDVTQDVFLRAYRQLPTLRDPARVGPWLVGIARQVIRESWRARKAQPLDERSVPVPDKQRADAEDRDELARVLDLVSRLPETERLAVHAFYLHEQDITTTARLLNLSRSGTYDLLKRACSRLARWMGRPHEVSEVPP